MTLDRAQDLLALERTDAPAQQDAASDGIAGGPAGSKPLIAV